MPTVDAKQQFLDVFRRERATTLKIMRAFPSSAPSFQPHATSQPALKLMWTFVREQLVITAALNGTFRMPPAPPPPPPETLAEVIAEYEKGSHDVEKALAAVPEARLSETIEFFTAPRTFGQVPVGEVIWLMLLDSVHHRGQLSVYLRMQGQRVPSIYGPSLDEPWM